MTERSFAEVPVGAEFLMKFAGIMTACTKKSDTHIDLVSQRGRVLEVRAWPMWGPCIFPEEYGRAQNRLLAQRNLPAVAGHSQSYPYGEF